jgi:hypothetical protein
MNMYTRSLVRLVCRYLIPSEKCNKIEDLLRRARAVEATITILQLALALSRASFSDDSCTWLTCPRVFKAINCLY